MKTFFRHALVVFAAGLCLAGVPVARATIVVDSTGTFDISSISGATITSQNSSTYGQAGGNAAYSDTGASSSASDTPVTGGSATGSGTIISAASGSASAMGSIPGNTEGFDTSCGQASIFGMLEVQTSGDVTFSVVITENLSLSADAYGVYGSGENVFSLSLNGNPILFYDQLLTVGPNQSVTGSYSDTMTMTEDLVAGQYYIYAQADSEAMVVNSSVAAVPETETLPAGCVAVAMLLLPWLRRHISFKGVRKRKAMAIAGGAAFLALASLPARATYLGGDAPDVCKLCGAQPTRQSAGTIGTSLTEGNIQENYPVVTVKSGIGPTLPFTLTYNSYNADGSKAQLDTGLGFGWTDTYNTLLFQDRGSMFRLDSDGRVTQYFPNYSGGGSIYTSDNGYFETITTQPDGSFILTNKFKSWWHFGTVPNTSLLIDGPVYRLLEMGDRNGNVTTMTYNSSGLLTTAADTYGRTLQFTYNSSNKLSSVEDPLGRITTFQYDSQDRMITQITDPSGKSVQYGYNAQYQMTSKVDRDGRTYYYMYKGLHPYAVTDSSGQPWFSMGNANNWGVNSTELALNIERQYVPGVTTNIDGNGRIWTYSYDTNGYITQITAPDTTTTTYTYDPLTRMPSSMTDANGHTTSYQYDADGNRISMTDALGDVTTYTYDPVFNELTSMTDPLGRTTQYQYDADGNRLHEIDPLNETNSWTYDSRGNVLSYTDKMGKTMTYAYDSFGDRTNMTDPLGNITSYAYDAVGNVISTTDANGNTTRYQYDALDRVIGMTNALGGVTTYTYDGVGRLTSMTDPNTNTTTNQYDNRGRLIQTTDALGGTTQNAYDLDNNRIATTDQLGHVTTYTYDSQNRMVDTTNAIGGVTSTTYDAVGNAISTTDPNGNTTRSSYDALNRVIGVTNALGGVTTYEYSMTGSPVCCSPSPDTSLITRMQDADGNITYYNYDELNRRTQVIRKNSDANDVINPGDAATITAYDANNNVISVTEPNGDMTIYTYDADNRRISLIDAAGDTMLTTYDGDGNVITVTDPNQNITMNSYDALNRIITVYDQIGLVRTTAYDADGNVISTVDGLGNTTKYTYDALNRQVTDTDPLGKTTTTAYDAVGNVISTIDRNGNTTTYVYDPLDRRISTTDALSNTNYTSYDANGNVISITDANNHTTSYTYDALNRQVTETYPDASSNTRTYNYDAVGNLIGRVDQKGQTTTYTYDSLYFLTNRAYLPSGSKDSFTYDLSGRMLSADRNGWVDTFAYDGANRLTNTTQSGQTLTYTYNIPDRVQTNTQPSGRTLVYAYDARDRLTTLGDETANPSITTYVYDDDNRVLTRNYRNGTTATYVYDADDRVTSLVHSNATSLITGFNYTYDNEGNALYEQRLDSPGNSDTYFYDALDRLTNYDSGTLSGSIIPSPTLAKAWNLDAVGNWNVVISNGVPDTRTYGPANELLTDNSLNYFYDADGNITNDNTYNYTYDEENRITQVQRRSDSAIVGQYYYDAIGRRVTSVTDPASVSSTNLYFYDGARIIEEQTPGGSTITTYTYGNYEDEALTMDRGGQTYYYHPNALWDVEALSGSTGNAVERYLYDAYGSVTIYDGGYTPLPLNPWGTPHSAVGNPFLFTGRELDEESGLYFYRARHYSPWEGRFLQRDPLDYAKGLNLYEYVNSRPTFTTDPSGLAPNISLATQQFSAATGLLFIGLTLDTSAGSQQTPSGSGTASSAGAAAQQSTTRPAAQQTGWEKTKAWFQSTVRLIQCCFKIVVNIEYEARQVQRGGLAYEQWRNLTYQTFSLGQKVSCTGSEVGVLWNENQWRFWNPPWAPSGEEIVKVSRTPPPPPIDPTIPPRTDAFSQAPPGGTEMGASADPQMLGD